MLTYLLDTDICIHVLKNRNDSLRQRFKANDGRMAVSDVTLFELAFGAEIYEDTPARLAIVESFCARLEIIPFNSRAAFHVAEIRARLESVGMPIGSYDLLIAAIARSQGLILFTNNLREFERVAGLRVERWS